MAARAMDLFEDSGSLPAGWARALVEERLVAREEAGVLGQERRQAGLRAGGRSLAWSLRTGAN